MGHCTEALSLFPQNVSILDEHSGTREQFGGIYARVEVCPCGVTWYNLVCLLPPLVFFFVLLFKEISQKDIQDNSVPFGMMTGMLAIFWSVFHSNLHFGRVD
jgi:hypothetical protein